MPRLKGRVQCRIWKFIVERANLRELRVIQKRRREFEQTRVRRRFGENVSASAEQNACGHDQPFAQRVNRRIRHLGKTLPKKMIQRSVKFRQDRVRRIVAHRAKRFRPIFRHRFEENHKLFVGVTE
ncbi:MAG: hypothetical protein HDKAJFGB_02044 [Anaerolineae bacterium]|nr:hypothetical protein [Anaerolineae bacterium]